ncbi:hypothetical protein [Endozoicomonas arenosclerae]|uniref:hypothetical protein n=1 Tax=Endozoicomonas arenosclerae TaxID=1633495 RepID=UPI001560BAEA|nr:hypothetical protein [Endozoicomonas arenosclerae]
MLIIVLVFSVFFGACFGVSIDRMLNSGLLHHYDYAIWRELEKNNHKFIDFKNLGNDQWTRICFLGPYNPESEELLGFSWNIEEFTEVLSSDSHNVIIYATEEEVIDFSIHRRSYGDFSALSGQCLDRLNSTVVFPIDRIQ